MKRADVNLISANWTGAGSGGATPVPESAGWALAGVALVSLAVSPGRRLF